MVAALLLLGGGLDAIVQRSPDAMPHTIDAWTRLERYRRAVAREGDPTDVKLRRRLGCCYQAAWRAGRVPRLQKIGRAMVQLQRSCQC